jgi:hypothetical protein
LSIFRHECRGYARQGQVKNVENPDVKSTPGAPIVDKVG